MIAIAKEVGSFCRRTKRNYVSNSRRRPSLEFLKMSHGDLVRAVSAFGAIGTLKKLFMMRTLKFGQLVGTDHLGNRYYENAVEYPHPQHRWVEFKGDWV